MTQTIEPHGFSRGSMSGCRCKRGEYVRPEDMLFLETMCKKYSVEYGAMDKKVFDETKPFGAA